MEVSIAARSPCLSSAGAEVALMWPQGHSRLAGPVVDDDVCACRFECALHKFAGEEHADIISGARAGVFQPLAHVRVMDVQAGALKNLSGGRMELIDASGAEEGQGWAEKQVGGHSGPRRRDGELGIRKMTNAN